jgi:hypothetical protein
MESLHFVNRHSRLLAFLPFIIPRETTPTTNAKVVTIVTYFQVVSESLAILAKTYAPVGSGFGHIRIKSWNVHFQPVKNPL